MGEFGCFQYYKYLQIWLPLAAYLLGLRVLKVVYMGDFWNDNVVDSAVSHGPGHSFHSQLNGRHCSQQQRVLRPSLRISRTALALSKLCWESEDVSKMSLLKIL